MFRELLFNLLALTRKANIYGLNFPMVKDPKTGRGSVSVTLVVMSSVMVILGLVGKWSGKLGIVDINNALEFFYASSALYFGRNWKSSPADLVKDDEPLEAASAAPNTTVPPKK